MSYSNAALGLTIDARLSNQQEVSEMEKDARDFFNLHRDLLIQHQEDIDLVGAAAYGDHTDPIDNLIDYLVFAYFQVAELFTENIWDIPDTNRQFMLVAELGDPDSADEYDRALALATACELLPGAGAALGIFGAGIKA